MSASASAARAEREDPAICGAFPRCAEEDSNLHPVIPDQALNPVHRLPIASIPRQIVTNRLLDWTIWTRRTTCTFSNLFSRADRARWIGSARRSRRGAPGGRVAGKPRRVRSRRRDGRRRSDTTVRAGDGGPAAGRGHRRDGASAHQLAQGADRTRLDDRAAGRRVLPRRLQDMLLLHEGRHQRLFAALLPSSASATPPRWCWPTTLARSAGSAVG